LKARNFSGFFCVGLITATAVKSYAADRSSIHPGGQVLLFATDIESPEFFRVFCVGLITATAVKSYAADRSSIHPGGQVLLFATDIESPEFFRVFCGGLITRRSEVRSFSSQQRLKARNFSGFFCIGLSDKARNSIGSSTYLAR